MDSRISLIVFLYFIKGTSTAITSAPENVINVSGTSLTLRCKSDATTSKTGINWVFSQYGTDYTATVVSECVPVSNGFSVISDAEGECNLVINNLDGRYAGQYTCENGAELPVSANVGVIVQGPECNVYPNSSIHDGEIVTIACYATYSGRFGYSWTYFTPSGETLEPHTIPSTLADNSDWNVSPNYTAYINSSIFAMVPTLKPAGYSLKFTSIKYSPPMNNATNDPTYQFEWISPALPVTVMYPPATSRMFIDGCITPLPLGAELTCSAEADPVPTYIWLHPNSTVSWGAKVKLNYLGSQLNYTCVASNSLGSADKYCIVTVLEYLNSAESTQFQNFSLKALLLLGVTIGYLNKIFVL